MGIADIASVAVRDPAQACLLVLQRLAPSRLLDRLEGLGAASGVTQPTFLLSFDCDTVRDFEVAEAVDGRLRDMGIRASYAVPGELLERGAPVWQRLAAAGAEFLNHGYREHTVFRDGRYYSTLFYESLTPQELEADVVGGHEAVARVIGRAPNGFRVPHFGTFRRIEDLEKLYSILRRLGYRFSTSTTPYMALRRGPFVRHAGIVEIPVSGCPDFPMMILDSYSFRFTAGRFTRDDYVRQVLRWAELLDEGRPLFVNLYADPSQVADWADFFTALRRLAPYAVTSFDQLLSDASL